MKHFLTGDFSEIKIKVDFSAEASLIDGKLLKDLIELEDGVERGETSVGLPQSP